MFHHLIKRSHHIIRRETAIVPFRKTPLVLLILDGWGHRKEHQHNAITQARTPCWDNLWKNNPHTLLDASGTEVGLPEGQVGNSEVGHMHIGAGRVVPQDLTRIEASIRSGAFQNIPLFHNSIQKLKQTGRTLHIMGLLSSGGVHSHEDHLFAFLDMCQQQNFENIALHLFLDGRDTPPKSALQSIERLEKKLIALPGAVIASMTGRHFALDRNNNWDRTQFVYELLTEGRHEAYFETPSEAIETYYQKGITDEHMPPIQIGHPKLVKDDDTLFFFNYRSDRARQLTESFISGQFDGFNRKKHVHLTDFISMTQYAAHLKTTPVFAPISLQNTLGECIANAGMHQLRLAETEKYAHVTFFFNGGSETLFLHEERILIPSPDVSTYDLQPEMSAKKITEQLVAAMFRQEYDLIICNFANADMVGHTGNLDATIRAIECLDSCLQQIVYALKFTNGTAMITADHGNAEIMFDDKSGQPHTAHTSEPVPCLIISPEKLIMSNEDGSLRDIAPTVLELLNRPQPTEMSGTSLLKTPLCFFKEAEAPKETLAGCKSTQLT